ncbi:MAG: HIT family protein [Ignavibacteria bacterium]
MDCAFCNISKDKIILQNKLAFAVHDKYPQSKGHLLIIPSSHCENFFACGEDEQKAMIELLNEAKNFSDRQLNPSGYKININTGKSAGQIIMHAHIHLIPCY